jgi:hypothetical protein
MAGVCVDIDMGDLAGAIDETDAVEGGKELCKPMEV